MFYTDQLKQFKRSLLVFILFLVIIFVGMLGIVWLVTGGRVYDIITGIKVMSFLDVYIFYMIFPLVVTANIDSFIASKFYVILRSLPGFIWIMLFSVPIALLYVVSSFIIFPSALARLLYRCKCERKWDYRKSSSILACIIGFVGGHLLYWMSLLVVISILAKFM